VESIIQPAWSSVMIHILVTGYQVQINMKSRYCFKVLSVQSHLSCFLHKVVHVSWCSVQYIVTDEVSAVTLSWHYVLPLHIIQVYPAVCVSCVLWQQINRPSALSDICFAVFNCNPIHARGMLMWSVLGRPQQVSCFSFLVYKLYWCWGFLHSRTGSDETKRKTQERMERRRGKRPSSVGSEKMERVGDR